MNFAAMTVWYNPDKDAIKHLYSYSSNFKTVYVVDNSESDNSNLFDGTAKENNIVYVPNQKNLGIAAALNIGCEKALKDGFDWILTMDQDSWWDKDKIELYINKVSKNDDDKIASFSANHWTYNKHCISLFLARKMGIIKDNRGEAFVNRCITSGNFIKLSVWNEIGRFNEKLFIDEVDHEYCFRLRKKDYKILQYKYILFHHSLGGEKQTFFPHRFRDRHSSFRLYYIYRNIFYIIKKYPEYAEEFNYEDNVKHLYKQYCTGLFNKNKDENLKLFIRAKNDSENL